MLQLGDAALGGADEVAYGRGALAHFLRGDTAIHEPGTPGFAVLLFNPLEHPLESGLVGGVAGEHFAAERKAFRRDNERDDHLHALATLIATVIEAAQAVWLQWIAFEVGAGEILEQDVELHVEKIAPALLQMRKRASI